MTTGSHRLLRMSGRDPHEHHRVATPLELLFDLTFVVAFGAAGNELAHALAEGHAATGLIGFAFAMFGTCWAWINFSWFASAYDTDDWAFRVLTMVQMTGVVIFALGLPEMFESLDEGHHIDNRVMVAGYVVMRVAMVGQWCRAMRQDPKRRNSAMVYIVSLVVSQAGWIALAIVDTSVTTFFLLMVPLLIIETGAPIVSERRYGGTPWHPHHIVERYGLLAIITLGEVVIGTVAAMSVHVHDPAIGWTMDAVIVLASGVGLTFGMWWTYFMLPWADILHHHRERSFFWGYGHILIFASIAATGAGLHVAQYFLEGESRLGTTGAVLTVAIPAAVFIGILYLMYAVSMRAADPFHLTLLAASGAVLVAAVVLANRGVAFPLCLVVVALTPVVTIVGYETIGHRHMQDHLTKLRT